MPISEEKKLILKMLQEGKITAEEAEKLLDALESKQEKQEDYKTRQNYKQPNFQDEVYKMKDKINDWMSGFKNNYAHKDFDNAIEDFVKKAEKLGKNVAATTFGIVDKMVDFVGSFVETNSFNMFGSYKTVEKYFEADAYEGMNLSIEGTNGYIIVKKHLDNRVIIKSKIKSPANDADSILNFSNTSGDIELKLNKGGNISVSHEVFVPALKFNNLKLRTANGKIYVEDSISQNFSAKTKNSHIELMGVNSDDILVKTRNAKIQISYVIGNNINVDTSNSIVDIKHVKVNALKAITSNGRIFVESVQNIENEPEISMELKTSNGGIKVNMNDMDNKGYKIKAQTTNGGVNILIPEMIYHNVNKNTMGTNMVEAESNGYNNFEQKVTINASTVNGYIEIVK